MQPKYLSPYHHSHIYYDTSSRDIALALQKKLAQHFGHRLQISRLIDEPIGPHPLPMFEADFRTEDFANVVEFLDRERNGLSVLVHPVTPDEVLDHTERATWLGNPLKLDIQFLHDFMAGKVASVQRRIKS